LSRDIAHIKLGDISLALAPQVGQITHKKHYNVKRFVARGWKTILKNKNLKKISHLIFFLSLGFLLLKPAVCISEPVKIKIQSILKVDPNETPLVYPTALYFDEKTKEMYVTDSGNGQFVIYNNNGYPTNNLGQGRGLIRIATISRIDNLLYVCCTNNQEHPTGVIKELNQAFFTEREIVLSATNKNIPSFIAKNIITGITNRRYVLQSSQNYVSIFDKNWLFIGKIVPREKRLGIMEPATIDAMTIDKNGNLYLLSEERGRVFVYNSKEEFQYSFGEKGGDVGKLARPRAIAIDSKNKRIYVCDYLRHAVLAYNTEGKYLFEIGSKGNRPGDLLYPGAVAVDHKGRLFVADTFNHRVQIFSISPQS